MTAERRRVVTWSAPTPPGAELSGLQAVQAAMSGALPPPPVAALLGITHEFAEAGRVRLAMRPAEFHYNPLGSVHGGVIATLLETAMAAAVRSTLPPGRACTTVEIKVSFARALAEAAGDVSAEGKVSHAGRQVALAEGRLTDAAGRLHATASATCLIQDAAPTPPPVADRAGERRRVVEWADPAEIARDAAGRSGLDMLRGHRVVPPVMALLGIGMAQVDPGCVSMAMPPGEHLFSQFGSVHGGMMATLLDSVMGCAVHTTLPAGRLYTTLEIKLSFLRRVTIASGLVTGVGQVQHAGRRMATAESRATDAAGRLCATGTTTCLVFGVRGPK